MRNRTLALRARVGGVEQALPVWWDDDDRLTCDAPGGRIVVAGGGDEPLATLLAELRARGLDPWGCFDCRFFHRPGDMNDEGGTFGYCLEGKTGEPVRMGHDTTTAESSCDAHERGDDAARAEVARTWAAALPRQP